MNVLVQNNVPVPLIQEALGHASIATTQHYLKKFANEEVDKVDMLVLILFNTQKSTL